MNRPFVRTADALGPFASEEQVRSDCGTVRPSVENIAHSLRELANVGRIRMVFLLLMRIGDTVAAGAQEHGLLRLPYECV
jgi:hypothetical protein